MGKRVLTNLGVTLGYFLIFGALAVVLLYAGNQ